MKIQYSKQQLAHFLAAANVMPLKGPDFEETRLGN